MKYSESAKIKEQQDRRKEELLELLREFEHAGFQTNKGSNTHTLASVVVDFINKVIDKRKQDLSILSLWDTQDMNALVPMLFQRYRVYNQRHIPETYDISALEIGKFGKLELFEPVFGLTKLVYVGANHAVLANVHKVQITKLTNEKPTPLGVKYDDLLAGSLLTYNDTTFVESFTSQTGVYNERDFVILPDAKGQAVFYPITDFKSVGVNGYLELSILLKTNQNSPVEINPVRDFVEMTPDLLRFTLTQLMQRFPTFRGITVEELLEFLQTKYQKPCILHDGVVSQDLGELEILEVNQFIKENVFGDYKIQQPITTAIKVTVTNKTIQEQLRGYLLGKIPSLMLTKDVKELVYKEVDMFYALTFGLDGNFAKSQNPCTIEVWETAEYLTDDKCKEVSKIQWITN